MRMTMSLGSRAITEALLNLAERDFRPAMEDALTRGAEAAVQRLRESADRHHGGGSGRMRDSIQASRPAVTRDRGVILVTLKGNVTPKWSYADQGAELNYGSKRRTNPSHWFDEGEEAARPEVEQIIRDTLDSWIRDAQGTA